MISIGSRNVIVPVDTTERGVNYIAKAFIKPRST